MYSGIKLGSSGELVRKWQVLLINSLDIDIETDGQFGPITERQTKEWQTLHGLVADGIVDDDEYNMISSLLVLDSFVERNIT